MSFSYEKTYQGLHEALINSGLGKWTETLPKQLEETFAVRNHGKMDAWQDILSELPDIQASTINLNKDRLQVGLPEDCETSTKEYLEQSLRKLLPWRKGPYDLFGLHINTEWRSDWKWQRIQEHLAPLKNRSVLDVGCGNGYHMWRMLGEGARLVVGVDPSQFFLVQFEAIKKYIQQENEISPVYLLPFKGEELPAFNQEFKGKGFDTVFSMGVLYHRISPIEHLKELRSFLRSGGELVLETLIIEGDDQSVLIPEDRYAKMRNVWFLPTTALLIRMLERAGFINIRLVDVNQTSLEEQRKTDWMEYESLADFLDPEDNNKTIEGYSAPKRAVLIANIP